MHNILQLSFWITDQAKGFGGQEALHYRMSRTIAQVRFIQTI